MGIAEMRGVGKMMSLLNYQMNSLPPTLLHLSVFFFFLFHPLPLTLHSSGFLKAAVRGAESFITHFVHVFLEFQSPILCPGPRRSFKSNVFSLSGQKACQHLAVWLKKGRSLSFKTFRKKKAAGNTACPSEAVRSNALFYVCLCLQHVSSQPGSSYVRPHSVARLNESSFVRALMYSI